MGLKEFGLFGGFKEYERLSHVWTRFEEFLPNEDFGPVVSMCTKHDLTLNSLLAIEGDEVVFKTFAVINFVQDGDYEPVHFTGHCAAYAIRFVFRHVNGTEFK